MKPRNDNRENGKLSGVEIALRRAGQRARELAAKTGTPLVIYSEGKIKKLRISKRGTQSSLVSYAAVRNPSRFFSKSAIRNPKFPPTRLSGSH
jgi:hypothetical protein